MTSCVLKKNIYLSLVFFVSLSFTEIEAKACFLKKDRNRKAFFNNDLASSTFPNWLSCQLLHDNILFGVSLIEADNLFVNLAYADTISRKLDISIKFILTKGGKVQNCQVKELSNTKFMNEIKHIVSNSRKWKASEENGRKIISNQHFTVPLDLKGEVVILDEGPCWGEDDKRVNGKRYNLTRYIHQLAMHIYNKCDDHVEQFEYLAFPMFPILGTVQLSFIIDEEGYFSDLTYVNDLSHIQFEHFISRQMFPGRLFSTEVKWAPAILDGKPVRVQVKAIIDYDNKMFSWDCFLLE